MFDVATAPDLLRLLAIPFFAYIAWIDIRTRRVPNRLWFPIGALAIVLLVWDLYRVSTGDLTPTGRQQFYTRTMLSLVFVVSLGYLFWRIGGFGGADAKAFFVLAALFPTYPSYELLGLSLPMVETDIGVFSLTIITNTVLIGVLYPVWLTVRNAAAGERSARMWLAKRVEWDDLTGQYGTLVRTDPESSGLRARLGGGARIRGVDLDALRMYLRWRGLSIARLRQHPDYYRDPESLPDDPNEPGDGSIPTDGWTTERFEFQAGPPPSGYEPDAGDAATSTTDDPDESGGRPRAETPAGGAQDDEFRVTDQAHEGGARDGEFRVADQAPADEDETGESGTGAAATPSAEELAAEVRRERGDASAERDTWGAAAFLEAVEGSAYGTSPEVLRESLDALAEEDELWVSPGMPFIVPTFLGLVVAFVFGDLLFAVLSALGIAA